MQQKHQEELDEKDRVIEELKNLLSHAHAQLGRDSSNSGLPTSRTPIGMEKRIPNSRRGTGKAKGGQPGHEKHTLEPPSAEEVNEITDVGTQAPETVCPTCGSGEYEYTGEWISRYEKDNEIRVVNREIIYYEYRCCLRFYGNELISYYVAHEKKDKAGLKEDRILWLLTSDTTVMHDHNTVNYNKELHFRNIECCQHLQRDIQRSADGTCHQESSGLHLSLKLLYSFPWSKIIGT